MTAPSEMPGGVQSGGGTSGGTFDRVNGTYASVFRPNQAMASSLSLSFLSYLVEARRAVTSRTSRQVRGDFERTRSGSLTPKETASWTSTNRTGLRHRQTKGAETDMLSLTSPRHTPTLPTPAVDGQRSTAGFLLQVGNDCSSGPVCSESQDRF